MKVIVLTAMVEISFRLSVAAFINSDAADNKAASQRVLVKIVVSFVNGEMSSHYFVVGLVCLPRPVLMIMFDFFKSSKTASRMPLIKPLLL